MLVSSAAFDERVREENGNEYIAGNTKTHPGIGNRSQSTELERILEPESANGRAGTAESLAPGEGRDGEEVVPVFGEQANAVSKEVLHDEGSDRGHCRGIGSGDGINTTMTRSARTDWGSAEWLGSSSKVGSDAIVGDGVVPGEVDDDRRVEGVDDSEDANGTPDPEAVVAWEAASRPTKTPEPLSTPYDDGGEPDFEVSLVRRRKSYLLVQGWLNAQAAAKIKSSKPLPKGLTKKTMAPVRSAPASKAAAKIVAQPIAKKDGPKAPVQDDDDWGDAWG